MCSLGFAHQVKNPHLGPRGGGSGGSFSPPTMTLSTGDVPVAAMLGWALLWGTCLWQPHWLEAPSLGLQGASMVSHVGPVVRGEPGPGRWRPVGGLPAQQCRQTCPGAAQQSRQREGSGCGGSRWPLSGSQRRQRCWAAAPLPPAGDVLHPLTCTHRPGHGRTCCQARLGLPAQS